jgi:phage shock protein E
MSIQAKLAAGAVVLDVRTPEEFAQGAYPGALHIPVQELAQRLGEVPQGKPIVIYCAAGGRAGLAAQLLQRAGHADVTNAGGLGDMPC